MWLIVDPVNNITYKNNEVYLFETLSNLNLSVDADIAFALKTGIHFSN